jgi:hypothetical protein
MPRNPNESVRLRIPSFLSLLYTYTVTSKDRFQGDIIVLSLQSTPVLTDSQSYFIESMLSHNCIQCNVHSLHYFFLFTDGNNSATVTCRNLIMPMSYTEKTVFYLRTKKGLNIHKQFCELRNPRDIIKYIRATLGIYNVWYNPYKIHSSLREFYS